MSSLYTMMAMNAELVRMHKISLRDGGNNRDMTQDLVKALGGIDFIVAYFLQQNVLNSKSLNKIKNVLLRKRGGLEAPDLNEMDDLLDQIEAEKELTKKMALTQKMLEISSANNANHENHANQHSDPPKPAEFGQMQSPINIISSTHCGHTKIMKDEEFASNPLKFNYPQLVRDCTIMNNGHTVQINIDPSNKCTLSIHGKTFELKQFHFHTPSEHTLDSLQYEMEMHLVHLNEDNEIAVLGFIFTTKQRYQRPKLELTKSRAHLVLSKGSMVYEQGKSSTLKIMKESDDEESDDLDTDDEFDDKEINVKKLGATKKGNDFLAQFWDLLPSEKTEKDIPLNKAISFDYLFETSSNNFVKDVKTNEIEIDMQVYEYEGSLTTPPYTEGVQWLVSKTTHFINDKQLNELSACWNHHNNARPVQEYFGRTVSLRSKSSMRVVT